MACKESNVEVINVTSKLYKCILCLKVFEFESEVENHIVNEHSCRTIGVQENTENSVSASGETPLNNGCRSISKTINCVNAQENVSYKCTICDEECHSLRYLNAHTIVVHENSASRNKCDICSEEFNSVRLLSAHKIVVHEGKQTESKINPPSDTREEQNAEQENGQEQDSTMADESKPDTFTEDRFHVDFDGSKLVEENIDEEVHNQVKITSVSNSQSMLNSYSNDDSVERGVVALVPMMCEEAVSKVNMTSPLSNSSSDVKSSISTMIKAGLTAPIKNMTMTLRRKNTKTSNNKVIGTENKSRLDNIVQVTRNGKKKYSNLHSRTKKVSNKIGDHKSKSRVKFSKYQSRGKRKITSKLKISKTSIDEEHEALYSCGICGLEVSMQADLRIHLRSHRQGVQPIDRKCHVCSEHFDTIKLLKTHMNIEHVGEKVFKCTYCPKSFNWKNSLLEHMNRVHEKEKLHHCNVCNKGFVRKSYLEIHESVHTTGVTSLRKGFKRHYCDVCNKSFTSSSSYKAHRRIHTREKPFSCLYCDKKFVTKRLCKDHMCSHTNNYPYHCDVCGKLFTRPGQLAIHKEKHNGKISNRSYKCDFCDKSFTSSSTHKAHRRVHTGEKPFDCLYCGKKFITKRGCSDHMTIHTNKKPHKCDECDKAFLRPSQLIIHKEIHKGGNPFTCETCGISFPTQGGLKYHFKKHDPNFKSDATECHFCSKSFVHIDLHIKTVHTGEKDFICEVCGKAFAGKNGLKKHMETHSGAKPFQCEICCRSFLRNTAMMRHMTIHSEEKPYVCDICNKSFHRKDTLTSHQKVHYKNMLQYATKF